MTPLSSAAHADTRDHENAAPVRERRFRAMGTVVHVTVRGAGKRALNAAERRVHGLEQLWSRCLATSEVTTLSRAGGRPVHVSSDTLLLLTRAASAWQATGGRFDPTAPEALVPADSDRTLEKVTGTSAEPASAPPAWRAPGLADLRVDWPAATVTLPKGVGFDPGGIGKGLAADLVAVELADGNVESCCVNLGGDLRVAGTGGWAVDVQSPSGGLLATMRFETGAIATSRSIRRGWRGVGDKFDHLIDPRTGSRAHTGLSQVTVVAGEAWIAQTYATASFVAGLDEGLDLLTGRCLAGVFVTDGGSVRMTREAGRYLA